MQNKTKLKDEIKLLKAEKKALEDSYKEAISIENNMIPEDTIKNIYDRNFSKIYTDQLNQYQYTMELKNKNKKSYHLALKKTVLPILLATGITLSTIGGVAICNKDNLDRFVKYHGYETQYTISYIDNKNRAWSEKLILNEEPDFIASVTIKKPLENTDSLVECYYITVTNPEYDYGKFLNMSSTDAIKSIKKSIIDYSNSIVKDDSISQPITEIAETKEVKSEYITSDTKKEGLHYPYYVGLSIFSGITMLIGTGITIGTAINEDLYFERSEYKGAKEKLKTNKKMMKIFKKKNK